MIVSLITKRKEMKNNFTKSRIYQNEATLFINPSKKQKAKANKPKLLISFIIVLIIFSSILTFSTLASNSENSWTVWYDDDYEFTYIDAWGSINKADLMTITINNNDCDTLSVNFFINSHDRERAKDGKRFILEITETPHEGGNWQEYKSEIYINYSELINNNIVYVLSFEHEFETHYWIDRLEEFEPFYFYLSINEHGKDGIDPSLYFEHTDNLWDMAGLKNTLRNAFLKCRLKSYVEIGI